jgi:hypothetical protein
MMTRTAWLVASIACLVRCGGKVTDDHSQLAVASGEASGAAASGSDVPSPASGAPQPVVVNPGASSGASAVVNMGSGASALAGASASAGASVVANSGAATPVTGPIDAAPPVIEHLDGATPVIPQPSDAGLAADARPPEAYPTITINAPATSVQPSSMGASGFCLCTRRDAVPAGMCPRGVGQSVTETIGPAGGEISLLGQQGLFVMTIPPTALAVPTSITVTETAIPPPAGFVDYSPVYSVEPLNLMFSQPVKLNIPFSNGRGFDVFDQNMAIFWSAASTFTLQRLPSTYINAGFAQGATGRGGYAIVGYGSAGAAPYCQ